MSVIGILKRRYEKYGMVASIIYIIPSKYTDTEGFFVCRLGYRMYDGFECFMLTDSQVQDYINRGNSIYRRDMSAYPATPSEEFSY